MFGPEYFFGPTLPGNLLRTVQNLNISVEMVTGTALVRAASCTKPMHGAKLNRAMAGLQQLLPGAIDWDPPPEQQRQGL